MGRRTENLLLDDVQDLGLNGIRVDIRGGAGYTSGHDAGDIIVGRPVEVAVTGALNADTERPDPSTDLYVIEEKYSASETFKYIQEDGDKFDAMIEFAESIGATPLLAVRWSTQVDWSPGATHFIVDARDVRRTDTNNVNVKPATAESEYETPEDFFGPIEK